MLSFISTSFSFPLLVWSGVCVSLLEKIFMNLVFRNGHMIVLFYMAPEQASTEIALVVGVFDDLLFFFCEMCLRSATCFEFGVNALFFIVCH